MTITLQLGNDAPMEGVDEAVELCVIITGVNASEIDLDVSLSTANGLAGEVWFSWLNGRTICGVGVCVCLYVRVQAFRALQ